MADKPIGQLNDFPQGAEIGSTNTLLVAQYSNSAYKLNGQRLVNALASLLDGHGGITSRGDTEPVAPSLVGTMVIALADETEVEVEVNQGKGIASIEKASTSGLVDTYRITYNDNTSSTFTVTNGQKGDKGDSAFVHIRYASRNPQADSDMSTLPDAWIGIYSGTSATAPTHYTSYNWYNFKGATGATGEDASISSTAVEYQEGTSGTVAPSGTWTTNVPTVTAGNFLWTRTTIHFDGEYPIVFYSVGRFGIDGTGAVSKVNNISPDGNGNVALAAANIPASDNASVQTHISDIETDIESLSNSVESKASATALTNHINNHSNPHQVTASQLGAAVITEYTGQVTASATWVTAGAIKYTDVTINGIPSGKKYIADVYLPGSDWAENIAIDEEWAKLITIQVSNGAVRLIAKDSFNRAVNFKILVVG